MLITIRTTGEEPLRGEAAADDVRYIRSTWVPEGEKCYCLFEVSSREAVEDSSVPAFLTAEDV